MASTRNGPLRSWSDGPAKAAILDFVRAVTTDGSSDFRPVAERVAVFDNDGTLWCEQPLPVQFLFVRDRIVALADDDPSLRAKQPYKAFLEHDHLTLQALGKKALLEIGMAVHADMSVERFTDIAADWMETAIHPAFDRPMEDVVYQPQLELLALLRDYGFTVYVVSGGGVDFIRAVAAPLYDLSPERIIGSSCRMRFDVHEREGYTELTKLPDVGSFDDRDTKVENIWLHIGRRPIFAFGNSDGDLAMLRYTLTGAGRRLAMLLHHDDAEREVAYDRAFKVSPLSVALDRAEDLGIRVVSMAGDWNVVMRRLVRGDGVGALSAVPRW